MHAPTWLGYMRVAITACSFLCYDGRLSLWVVVWGWLVVTFGGRNLCLDTQLCFSVLHCVSSVYQLCIE